MKIVIVMAYYDRPMQLTKTLYSINKSNHSDTEIIIVDDCSVEKPIIPDMKFRTHLITIKKKYWVNGVPAYNMGIDKAIEIGADIIIIQNPECYHVGDVVSHASNISTGQYYTYACFSLDENHTFKTHDIIGLIQKHEHGATFDGQLAWYNHSKFRSVKYHFCSAISVSDLVKLNGFDERFAYGIAYEDNYFLHQAHNLGLESSIIDSPFVVHQWHNSTTLNKQELIMKNKNLYISLSKNKDYKAQRLIT